jgi:hypothetical protein
MKFMPYHRKDYQMDVSIVSAVSTQLQEFLFFGYELNDAKTLRHHQG